jgi:uncharacterized membrane protein
MRSFFQHVRTYIFRGFLAIIPLALTFLALRILYVSVDQRAVRVLEKTVGFGFPGLGLIFVLLSLYLLGVLASNVAGKGLFRVVENLTARVPLIRTTYKVGQQLGVTMSLPEKEVFKRAVLVEYLKPGIWTIGFVTGMVVDRSNKNEKLLKVFVPTPPNPVSGTMVLVRQSETRDPGWTIEEALKAVISGGPLGPEELG